MKCAVIEGGTVINVVEAAADVAAEHGWVECNEEVGPGWGYAAGEFSRPERNLEAEGQRARFIRNAMLQESDVRMLSDRWAAMSPEEQAAWAAYRQALRDLPSQPGFPAEIDWPIKPE